ncbi:MAG: hypothetical protein WDO71_24450 [Bacteroidota bacterium]
MRAILFIVFILPALAVFSQATVVDVGKDDMQVAGTRNFYTVGGSPVTNTKYVKVVEGSPYFSDSWMKGKLALANGEMYDSLRLRLDLAANELQYISPEGKELIATTPVKGVTLKDSISGKQYHFVHSSFLQLPKNMESGWYQLLVQGPATLYKHIVKTVNENKPYGSATVEQTIKTTGQYFVVFNGVFTRIKKIKELPDTLKNKKIELDTYISSQGLAGRSDGDYSSLIAYYNSLVEK